jgi:hypothetical protein
MRMKKNKTDIKEGVAVNRNRIDLLHVMRLATG